MHIFFERKKAMHIIREKKTNAKSTLTGINVWKHTNRKINSLKGMEEKKSHTEAQLCWEIGKA